MPRRPRYRPPGKPRRPANAFLLWLKDNKERLKQEHPEAQGQFSRLTPIAAQEWRRLPDEQKQHYIRAAEVEKQRYRNAMQVYMQQQPMMQIATLPLQQDSATRTVMPNVHDHTATEPTVLLCLRCGTEATANCFNDAHSLYGMRMKPTKDPQEARKPPISPVVEVAEPLQHEPSKGGEDEKSSASTAKAVSEQGEVVPPEVSAPPNAGGEEQPEHNATVELPNNEQSQQVPQQPAESQQAGPKEWGGSVHLP